jgi:hypothetical protein
MELALSYAREPEKTRARNKTNTFNCHALMPVPFDVTNGLVGSGKEYDSFTTCIAAFQG